MKLTLQKKINQLGNLISTIIPAPYTRTSLADNLKSYGIRVAYFTDEPYRALVFWDHKTNRPTIALNAFLDSSQTNFWLGHELGHLLINYHWSPLDGICEGECPTEYCGSHCPFRERKNERIMDRFAESYLMPVRLLKPFVANDRKKNVPDYAIINEMTFKFRIPRTKAKERFSHLPRYLNSELVK